MLTIGEFSNICQVSAKTLRYYASINLLAPSEINPENGYRYYAIEQLETMLLINRLKSYSFSLDEIKQILQAERTHEENVLLLLAQKKKELQNQMRDLEQTIEQMQVDISALQEGKPIMSYMENIGVQLMEVPKMNLLSVRKMVQREEFPGAYAELFGKLFKTIALERLTMLGAPMVLFHSEEYSHLGLDTEFAIPVIESVTGTRDFSPGLCLKTVVRGAYSELSSVYAKQRKWAEKEGYQCTNALFEVYVTDPSMTENEKEQVTEVYYPVKKCTTKGRTKDGKFGAIDSKKVF